MRGEKPPKKSSFPCLSALYYDTHEIFRVSEVDTRTYTCTHVYRRTYYARSTARSCPADHPRGYFTAASAVSPCRKVPNGEAGLKKRGSGGANTWTKGRVA